MPRTFQEDLEYHTQRLQAQREPPPSDEELVARVLARQKKLFEKPFWDHLQAPPRRESEKFVWKKRQLGIVDTDDKAKEDTDIIMPVHPKGETVQEDNITDRVAKESGDSTASSHSLHHGDKANALDHTAHPGPVIAENLGQPASKEELRKRAEELNK